MNNSASRLADVREHMSRLDLDALIIPRADEYLGEYIPERNERMRWVSGFTGSAGVVVVLSERAAIFVDGRYTVQVRKQVSESLFEIHHLLDEPHLEWLADELEEGARIGFDPRTHPYQWYRQAVEVLEPAGIQLIETDPNVCDQCWDDRPEDQVHPAILMPKALTGRNSLNKRRVLAAEIKMNGAEAALIFAADSCAWLLNIRGQDVPCLPVVLGFGLLYADGQFQFFTHPEKIPDAFSDHVGLGVEVLPESAAKEQFTLLAGQKVLADPATSNAWSQLALLDAGVDLIARPDLALSPKACKNASELAGMKRAHVRDGVAVVRFLSWLDREVEAGNLHSEAALSEQMRAYRASGDHFMGDSFDTISAAGGNAAMCHYNHNNFEETTHLQPNTVFLIDSGGQYLDGTTDITRTISIGDPGQQVKDRFTLVLKGHIALACARFPQGTIGTQLDVLARQFLWQAGLDYDHGTGHGVGAFLSVHEGPQRIGKAINDHALRPGMVVSNEPGFYLDGQYGMRCENLVFVRESATSRDPLMLEFEALTLAPFDKRLINSELLTAAEKTWLNRYHKQVLKTIAPELDAIDRGWLELATRPV